MVMSNAESQAREMGGEKNRQAHGAENDPNRVGVTEAASGGGGGIGGRLPGDGGATVGKDLGQWVAKNLEYQLAYHSSSVNWYATEIERCQAEIEKFQEAIAWHKEYLTEAQADLEAFSAPAADSDPEE